MPETAGSAHFILDFGLKSLGEVVVDGRPGLLIAGYATRFNEADAEGEVVDPQALRSAARTFFDYSMGTKVPIIYHHGFDTVLSTKHLGYVTEWTVDHVGLHVKAFLPQPSDSSDSIGERARTVYEGVKNGLINGFSIGGVLGKVGRAIKSIGLYEISLTPTPCLDSARFSLAAKSLPAVLAADSRPTTVTQTLGDPQAFIETAQQALAGKSMTVDQAGVTPHYGLSRDAHARALAVALDDQSYLLHDHLLGGDYPLEQQGDHAPSLCPLCADRREMLGVKSAPEAADLPREGIDPQVFAARLTDLSALASGVAEVLHYSGSDGVDAKAGRALSTLSLSTLRSFATAVVAAGNDLHAWLDKNAPPPKDDADEAAAGADPSAKDDDD